MTAGRARDSRWRLSTLQVLAGVLAVSFLGVAVGFAISRVADQPPSRSSVDVGFLYDMIRHHEQAQELANVELANGAENDVIVFAREVLLFQSYEIGLMEAYLDEWGYDRGASPETAMGWMGRAVPQDTMPGLASEADLDRLADSSGRDADALFVRLLKDHHAGGVHMASFAAREAGDRRVRQLARRITTNQRTEIAELEAARQRLALPVVEPTRR